MQLAARAAAQAARQLNRDHVVRAHTQNVRIAVAQATMAAETARRRFGITDARVTSLHSRLITASALMSSLLRGEERVILQYVGPDGDPVSRLYAEAMATGEIRGFAVGSAIPPREDSQKLLHTGERRHDMPPPPPLYPLPASAAHWDGRLDKRGELSVTRVLYGNAQPVVSMTGMVAGDITSDLQHFFQQSEQVDSVLRLEVDVDGGSGAVRYAGGVLAQRIATGGGKSDDAAQQGQQLTDLAGLASRLPPLSYDVDATATATATAAAAASPVVSLAAAHRHSVLPADVVRQLLPELAQHQASDTRIFVRTPIDYYCRCSKEGFLSRVVGAGAALLEELTHADGAPSLQQQAAASEAEAADMTLTSLSCHFCNAAYPVTLKDVRTLRTVVSSGGSSRDQGPV